MKILLIDLDSKIPNLALMKISAYHQSKGDEISFNTGEKGYCSIIFQKSRKDIQKLLALKIPIEFGGVGYDPQIKLCKEIESLKPDYSLYPNMDYSLGYTYRACPRRCPFCVVPKMSQDKTHHSIYEFWDPRHRKIRLLNNNTFADPLWKQTFEEIIDNDLMLIDDGFDIRLLDDEKAFCLSKVRFAKQIHFAFDNLSDELAVTSGIKLLEKYGVRAKRLMFYVLCGYNTTFEEDSYRVKLLKSLGVDPFIMLYHKSSVLLNEFARWVNRFYFKVSFKQFLVYRKSWRFVGGMKIEL